MSAQEFAAVEKVADGATPQIHASIHIERVGLGTDDAPREERILRVDVDGSHRAVEQIIAAAAGAMVDEVER